MIDLIPKLKLTMKIFGALTLLKITSFSLKLFKNYFLRKFGLFYSFPKDLKWVAITGATDGLGKEFVKILKEKNIGIIAFGRNMKKLDNLKKSLEKENFTKIYIVQLDQGEGDLSELEQKVTLKIKNLPEIDLLINNAGQFKISKIYTTNYSTYISYFNLNALSHLAITNSFLKKKIDFTEEKHLKKNLENLKIKVICISSFFSKIAIPLSTFHSFTKRFVNNYVYFLRRRIFSNFSIFSTILMGEMMTKMNNKFDLFLEEVENEKDSIKKKMKFGYVLPSEAAFYVLGYSCGNFDSAGHPEHEVELMFLNPLNSYMKIRYFKKRLENGVI